MSVHDLGFPLDDGWIHQTYARNLVRYGQLAYVPGQPSAGSTAPLWTLLLSAGYFLGLDFKPWTYCLGLVLQTLTAWAAYRLAARLWPRQTKVALLAGLFCALEWHLVWAAFSGMETILFILLALWLMERYLWLQSQISIGRWSLVLGLLGGLPADNRKQLEKLLELYLLEDFDKGMLIERKSRPETAIAALEKEQADLVATLEAQTLSHEQIETIEQYAREIAGGLEEAEKDLARRRIIEGMEVGVRLVIEDGLKVAYASWLVGKEERLLIEDPTSCISPRWL